MNKLWKRCNDKGSALLTVILVVAFLTILATTLLYVTGMNFQIKQADYQNKKNFYTGETALEEIRAELMKTVSKATTEAYNGVCMEFVTCSTKEVRQLEYNRMYTENMLEALKDDLASHGGNWTGLLGSYYTDTTNGTLEIASPTPTYDGAGDLIADATLEIDEVAGIVVIKGLKMTYINDRKLATILTTDLELRAPDIDWSAESTTNSLSGSGVTQEEAATKHKSDVSKCVVYTNWKKE